MVYFGHRIDAILNTLPSRFYLTPHAPPHSCPVGDPDRGNWGEVLGNLPGTGDAGNFERGRVSFDDDMSRSGYVSLFLRINKISYTVFNYIPGERDFELSEKLRTYHLLFL